MGVACLKKTFAGTCKIAKFMKVFSLESFPLCKYVNSYMQLQQVPDWAVHKCFNVKQLCSLQAEHLFFKFTLQIIRRLIIVLCSNSRELL